MKAAVIKETAPGEHRVALVPEAVTRLRPDGIDVLVERGRARARGWPTPRTPRPARLSSAPTSYTAARMSSLP